MIGSDQYKFATASRFEVYFPYILQNLANHHCCLVRMQLLAIGGDYTGNDTVELTIICRCFPKVAQVPIFADKRQWWLREDCCVSKNIKAKMSHNFTFFEKISSCQLLYQICVVASNTNNICFEKRWVAATIKTPCAFVSLF